MTAKFRRVIIAARFSPKRLTAATEAEIQTAQLASRTGAVNLTASGLRSRPLSDSDH